MYCQTSKFVKCNDEHYKFAVIFILSIPRQNVLQPPQPAARQFFSPSPCLPSSQATHPLEGLKITSEITFPVLISFGLFLVIFFLFGDFNAFIFYLWSYSYLYSSIYCCYNMSRMSAI